MVDVSAKDVTERKAQARAVIELPSEIVEQLTDDEIHVKKGPVFQTAILAGIMAVKKTSDLIPLCHPLPISKSSIDIKVNGNEVFVDCLVKVTGKTGVEMEALTAASASALTMYDMMKWTGQNITISDIKLLEKSGGKSGDYCRS